MKMKKRCIWITVAFILGVALVFLFPDMDTKAESVTTKTLSVPPNGTYKIHGIYIRTVTTNTAHVKNYSKYGEYAYCKGYVSARIGSNTDYTVFSSEQRIDKDNSYKTITLYNTLDAGNRICLKVTGADTQTVYDTNKISFYY